MILSMDGVGVREVDILARCALHYVRAGGGAQWTKIRFFFQNKITTQKPAIWMIFVSTYSKLNVD